MKKLKKDAKSLIGTGIVVGVGSSAVASAGGDTGGLSALGRGMKPIGTLAAAGAVMRGFSYLGNQTKKMKKKY